MRHLILACLMVALALPAAAQDRRTLGVGRLFVNDVFFDLQDRWRTGSYVLSVVRGADWTGTRPVDPGVILEWRLRTEAIAGSRLNGPGSFDRPYVGLVAFGAHTYMTWGGGDLSAGLDVVTTGPQTGIADGQDWFHGIIDAPAVSDAVKAFQIPNGRHLHVTAEYARPVALGDDLILRPFIEAQAGPEEILRVGVDAILGPGGPGALWLRDNPTGQLYPGIANTTPGLTWIAGADIAAIGPDSLYLPESLGYEAEEWRARARLGVNWQITERASVYYGVTWHSEEFKGQPEGQVTGAIRIDILF